MELFNTTVNYFSTGSLIFNIIFSCLGKKTELASMLKSTPGTSNIKCFTEIQLLILIKSFKALLLQLLSRLWISLFWPSFLSSCLLFYLFILFLKYFFKFICSWETQSERERQRHRQRGKQVPCREPNVGLDPRSPGPCPGSKAGTKRWATRAALIAYIFKNSNLFHYFLWVIVESTVSFVCSSF